MGDTPHISVIITTFNRCQMLSSALAALLAQDADDVPFEIIVVDNNSTDGTRQVVESCRRPDAPEVRYRYEKKQGISYGRNAGLAEARAPIIAFTDDDVRVAPDWVRTIRRVFDQHPDVDFIGGKILPRWKGMPPDWLTQNHWWPLALLDYGDEPFYVNARTPLCLPTANASFRRRAFDRVGTFSSAFSGREDHELLVRLWRAGRQGLYVPDLVVTADVQPERMSKRYHHRWNKTTGRFNSLMGLDESMGPHGDLVGERADLLALFGTPVSLYRDLLFTSLRWLAAVAQLRESLALQHENRIYYLMGYISERYRHYGAPEHRGKMVEISSMVKSLIRNKLSPK